MWLWTINCSPQRFGSIFQLAGAKSDWDLLYFVLKWIEIISLLRCNFKISKGANYVTLLKISLYKYWIMITNERLF